MQHTGSSAQNWIRRAQIVAGRGPGYLLRFGRWQLWRAFQARARWPRPTVDLFRHLDLDRPGLVAVAEALERGDRPAAETALVEHLAARPRPRFFFGEDDREAMRRVVSTSVQQATIAAAEEVCQRRFRFRGQPPVQFDGRIDWRARPGGNVDWTWDLNRHGYFVTLGRAYWYTGEERFCETFCHVLLDWIAQNATGVTQPATHSVFEVAARLHNWLWAFAHFRAAPTFQRRACIPFLRSLFDQARYLEANLEHHATNNHLLLESWVLAWVGLTFPEFRRASHWRERGLRVFYRQVREQVAPDGVHREQATLYHFIVTQALLSLDLWLAGNGLSLPDDVADHLRRMHTFARAVRKPDGTFPLLGDSARSDSFLVFDPVAAGEAWLDRGSQIPRTADLDEGGIWLVGPALACDYRQRPFDVGVLASQAFVSSGHFVMRHGEGEHQSYAHVDCGFFGHEPVPNHGHADALSLVLHAYGHTLLPDAGAYGYYLGLDWRAYFRGTRAHNTVLVDGEDQSELLGIRHVGRVARTALRRWFSSPAFDLVDGSHDGYTRLPDPVVHRRVVLFVKGEAPYWLVLDHLTGSGTHQVTALFHLAPAMRWHQDEGGRVHAWLEDGAALHLLPGQGGRLSTQVVCGATQPIQGWVSPESGERLLAPTVCYTWDGPLPLLLATVLFPEPRRGAFDVRLSPLTPAEGEVGLVVTGPSGEDVALWRAAPGPMEADSCRAWGEMAVWRRSPQGRVQAALLVQGTSLETTDRPLITAPSPQTVLWSAGRIHRIESYDSNRVSGP